MSELKIKQEFIDGLFPGVVGQKKVKRQLSFYVSTYYVTQILPHLLIIGGKGSGKTHLSTLVARNLKVNDLGGNIKPMLKINCATIKKLSNLIQNVLLPYIREYMTIFFDECHALEIGAQEALLTALSPDKNFIGYINHQDGIIEINYKKISCIFATTQPDLLNNAFKDRLRVIQLEPYSRDDLANILQFHSNEQGIEISSNVLFDVASVCRGNPRSCVKMANEIIVPFCQNISSKIFEKNSWNNLRKLLSIYPLGLGETELQILRELEKTNYPRSLTSLAASTGLEKSAIQGEYEHYLMKMGLMEIAENGRKLTEKGKQYLEEFNLLF